MEKELVQAYTQTITFANGWATWNRFYIHDNGGLSYLDGVSSKYVPFEQCARDCPQGLILEFGVRTGNTIRELAKAGRKVYGFDWWKGLPNEWEELRPRGILACPKPEVPDNVELIEGLFSDTLEEFLVNHPGPVGCVNVDCDIYTSTMYVLNTLRPRFIPGSLICFSAMWGFDFPDQQRAFDKFGKDNWEFIGKQHDNGEVYRCVDSRKS